MPKLTRAPSGSGSFQLRKRLPADIRLDYQTLYGGPAWEVKATIPAGTPPEKARVLHAEFHGLIDKRIAALKASKGGKGVDLTQRQADALAGDWYRWFTAQHEDNPGNAERWSGLREALWNMAELAGDQETREASFDDPEVMGAIDIEARASQFLMDHGVALTSAGRTNFLSAVASEFLEATKTLERRARRDWGPDQHLVQLPASPSLNGQHSAARAEGRTERAQLPSAMALFEISCKDRHLKPTTIMNQRGVFTALDKEDWRAPNWNAQQWLDSLVTDDRAPQTVRKWLVIARALFTWAKRRRHVETNPFQDCFIIVPKRPRLRETDKAFTTDEIQTILCASRAIEDHPMKPWDAARRWVPWLLAYTGARAGEITQLRVQDVEMRMCGPVLRITSTKTNTARWVPLHSHLDEMGFRDYVASVEALFGKPGPLFYRPRSKPSKNHPALNVRQQLSTWIRELGVPKGVQPLHGWRHTWKTRALRAKIEERIRDAICGHAPKSAGAGYEHPTVEDMAEALKSFPRYEVE